MKLSRQQQAVKEVIEAAGEAGVTSWDLVRRSKCINATARLSELNEKGWHYRCERVGKSDDGSDVFRYKPPYIKPGQQLICFSDIDNASAPR